MRCAICGKPLKVLESLMRGIGPVCAKRLGIQTPKTPRQTTLKIKIPKQNEKGCKVCGAPIEYFFSFEQLGLPCNHYCCSTDHCPFFGEETCPREKIYVKGDIYPLYMNKEKHCSFCGKQLYNNSFRKYIAKTKMVLECYECRKTNRKWRI